MPPDLENPADAFLAGVLAYVPLAIGAHIWLDPFIDYGVWQVLAALFVAIPLAMLVGMLANWLAGQKVMLEAAKNIIAKHDPNAWDEMTNFWEGRRKEAQARTTAESRAKEKAGQVRSTEPSVADASAQPQSSELPAADAATRARSTDVGAADKVQRVDNKRCPICKGEHIDLEPSAGRTALRWLLSLTVAGIAGVAVKTATKQFVAGFIVFFILMFIGKSFPIHTKGRCRDCSHEWKQTV